MITHDTDQSPVRVLFVYELGEEFLWPEILQKFLTDDDSKSVAIDFIPNTSINYQKLSSFDILVLANVYMPSPNGFDIALHAYQQVPDLPIVVASAFPCLKSQLPPSVVSILLKPITARDFVFAIGSLALNVLLGGGRIKDPREGQELIQLITPDINVIRFLAEHDRELYKIPSRFFEELLAELLFRQGWEIQLSPIGADGGIDIVAVRKTSDISQMMLVQAKRYSEHRKVGVSVVRELLHVIDDRRAPQGMIVTTSTFTKVAEEEQRAYRWILSLKDHDQIVKWLKDYQNGQRGQGL